MADASHARIPGKFPHTEWLDLGQNGVLVECAVMRRDETNGDVYFFPLESLDGIDKSRLTRILLNRNATLFSLWDLMSGITLGNGVNALTYFNQLVRVRTHKGEILAVSSGRRGMPEVYIAPLKPTLPQKSE